MPAGRPRKYYSDEEKHEAQKNYAKKYYANKYKNDDEFRQKEKDRANLNRILKTEF